MTNIPHHCLRPAVPAALLALAVAGCGGGGGGGGAAGPSALDVVREAYYVMGLLGNAGLTLGQQFQSGGILGQAATLGPGTVGPTPRSCPTFGVAIISGELQAAGQFSAGDTLEAAYQDCANPAEELDGIVDLEVLDWQSTGGFGFTYAVTFTATLTDFVRAATGLPAVTTNGVLTHTLDGLAQSGSLLLAVTTDDLEFVDADGTRTLANAQNAATFSSPGGTFVVTTTASGDLASSVLGRGTFAYETTLPLESASDNDPATGPTTGQLKVTLPDGGSVTMVVVDNVTVRLDIDEDGDGLPETSEDWTWSDVI